METIMQNVNLFVKRNLLEHQKMVTGKELTPEQEAELRFIKEKIESATASKQTLENKIRSGNARKNDLKKLASIHVMLHGWLCQNQTFGHTLNLVVGLHLMVSSTTG